MSLFVQCALASALLAAPQEAEGLSTKFYARVPLPALELTEGALPEYRTSPWSDPRVVVMNWPYVVIEGGGQAYVDLDVVADLSSAALALEINAPREVAGRLFVPAGDGAAMQRVDFRVLASAFGAEHRDDFLRAKAHHYELLASHDLPGTAWYRHQARAARKALGEEPSVPNWVQRPFGQNRTGELDDTFELFGGGRAIAENLQLDRELPFGAEGQATVDLDAIQGVETGAYDWSKEIAGLEPELDPLAAYIPADQYAAFFPSIEALVRTLDELEAHGNPLLSLAEGRAENARTRARYQRQLCLPFDDPSSPLRTIPIEQIAITGTDPFFRTGTDITVLFATTQPEALFNFVKQQIEAAERVWSDARSWPESEAPGLSESVFTPDREVSCRLLHWPETQVVIVTNRRDDAPHLGVAMFTPEATLASAPEYVFFRHRYPWATANEEGLLVLTDAVLRRWVGPRMRIAASRRTQAAAWLADAQCSKLAFDSGDTDAVLSRGLPDDSPLVWDKSGARSDLWGTTSFLTPIAELELERVTPAEQEAYERFRQRYQAGWRAWFDPIAVRLVRRGEELDVDVTVRPLIAGSDYREWMDVVGDAQLAPTAGDPHAGSLGQFAMALDLRSHYAKFASAMLAGEGPEPLRDALSWIGGGIGVYLEPDADFFAGWRAAKSVDEEDLWFEKHLSELPLALHVESKSPVQLALFMASLRAFVEHTAPGLLTWKAHEGDGGTLVEIRGDLGDAPFSIWYATLPEALIVTLREDVLRAAVQRSAERKSGSGAAPQPWQGESLALRLDGDLLDLVRDLTREETLLASRSVAWSALPILREYRQRFPERDPIELHEALFGVRLEDPAGGTYVWDERWSSYASSLYGHPAAPMESPSWPLALERLEQVDLGVTFESDGLRGRAVLRR